HPASAIAAPDEGRPSGHPRPVATTPTPGGVLATPLVAPAAPIGRQLRPGPHVLHRARAVHHRRLPQHRPLVALLVAPAPQHRPASHPHTGWRSASRTRPPRTEPQRPAPAEPADAARRSSPSPCDLTYARPGRRPAPTPTTPAARTPCPAAVPAARGWTCRNP